MGKSNLVGNGRYRQPLYQQELLGSINAAACMVSFWRFTHPFINKARK